MTLISSDYTFFGVSATYTPVGGSGSSVTVIIDEDHDLESLGGIGGARRHTGTISVQISEVAAKPTPGATFMVTDGEGNDQTWTVVAEGVKELPEIQDFDGEWVCKCERNLRPVIIIPAL